MLNDAKNQCLTSWLYPIEYLIILYETQTHVSALKKRRPNH